MLKTIKNNPISSISVGSIVVILSLIAGIIKVDDRYAKAGDIDTLKRNQSAVIDKIDKHLDFEKQQAIYDLEDKIEILEKIPYPTPEEVARKNKYIRRLQLLYDN